MVCDFDKHSWFELVMIIRAVAIFMDLGSANANYLVNTLGCRIPHVKVDYPRVETQLDHCGTRYVHVSKVSNNTLKFQILDASLYRCTYRFMLPHTDTWRPDTTIKWSGWKPFRHRSNVQLESDFLRVFCLSKTKGRKPYDDAYAVIKKVQQKTDRRGHWNVLVIGMDTMARMRAYAALPKTVEYLTSAGWLDFKGYNKVAFNTFPNLVRVLTNRNLSTLERDCDPDMYSCNNAFIWNRFKQNGYVTAYGEDWHRHQPGGDQMMRFRKVPTDHYLRTFFLGGESYKDPYYCMKTMLSPIHVLKYAHDFMDVYKLEKFFGFFWLNSFSHEPGQSPSMVDDWLKSYFRSLEELDVMKNTFVVFFSDHGTRYAEFRDSVGFFYENRLPMLFMRIPERFKNMYPNRYNNLQQKKTGLVVPFDLHLTLWDIATNFELPHNKFYHESCLKCRSLFYKFDTKRTCSSAGVEGIWCTCRDLTTVTDKNIIYLVVNSVIRHINQKIVKFRLSPGYTCRQRSLKKMIRIHSYVENGKFFYIIAGRLNIDNTGFEAIVASTFSTYKVELLDITTQYHQDAACCKEAWEKRCWCICKKKDIKTKNSFWTSLLNSVF